MKRIFAFVISLSLLGCSALAGKATIYTEQGVRLAAEQWDVAYYDQLNFCQEKFPVKGSPEAEKCFGAYFDADGKVATAVRSIVALLRTYWLARSKGMSPDWAETAKQVLAILDDLPPEAREYFDRVEGI